jgi:hypothetical protein
MLDITTLATFLVMVGGLCLAFAAMAILSDVIIPAIQRHTWRGRRIRERIARVTRT